MISVLNHQVRVFFPDELQGTLLERTFMLRFGTVIRTELREEVTHFFTEVSVVHKGIIEDFDISEGVVGNEEVFTLSNKKYTFHFLMELPIGRGTETAWKVLIGERWLLVDIAGGQGLSALYVRYKKSNSSGNFIFTSPSQWC